MYLGKGSLHRSMKRKLSDNVVHKEAGLSSGNPMYLGKGTLQRSIKRKSSDEVINREAGLSSGNPMYLNFSACVH